MTKSKRLSSTKDTSQPIFHNIDTDAELRTIGEKEADLIKDKTNLGAG